MHNSSAPPSEVKRILLVTCGAPTGTSANLFVELARTLAEHHICRKITINPSGSSLLRKAIGFLAANLHSLAGIVRTDVVITHVFASFTLPMLILSRALGKKVIIFQWDIYPTTIAGQPYMTSRLRRMAHRLEHLALRLATVIVVPSEDFRNMAAVRDPVIFPLWPQSALRHEPVHPQPMPDGICHIAFAGQINELRGLHEFITHLQNIVQNQVVLHVFSVDELGFTHPSEGNVRITHHGHVPRHELRAMLRKMHFGLISLNPKLDQPGFPSKVFDYMAAGLPVLYFGRPLPAFTQAIEMCGVGLDITSMTEIGLLQLYQKMIFGLEAGRDAWIAHTILDQKRLATLL